MALQEELEVQGNWLFRYRGTLPIFILIIGMIVFLWTKTHPETFILENTPYETYYQMFCLAASLFGFAIRVYTVSHTPKDTSGRNIKNQIAFKLNTSGIYSMLRHPLYLGNFFMWLGPALLTGNLWFMVSFVLFYWVYYERIMFAEEQYLRKQFGSTYTDWAATVPAFMPSCKNFVKPNLPFNWKKVIMNEKNGLLAVFVIFALFDFLGNKINNESNYNYIILAGCVVSGVYYLVVKFLVKRTRVFDDADRK